MYIHTYSAHGVLAGTEYESTYLYLYGPLLPSLPAPVSARATASSRSAKLKPSPSPEKHPVFPCTYDVPLPYHLMKPRRGRASTGPNQPLLSDCQMYVNRVHMYVCSCVCRQSCIEAYLMILIALETGDRAQIWIRKEDPDFKARDT